MKKGFLVSLFTCCFVILGNAQVSTGIEVQWYPAGYQFMLTGEYSLNEAHAIQAKFGYNLARRKGFSPYNDLENGGGLGATLGYRYYFGAENSGLYLGARADIWALTIDWEDESETPNAGSTKITVFQPTGEIGYMYTFEESPLAIGVNVAAGYEINVVTKGEAVGEGAIGLFGIIMRYRIFE